MTTPSTRKKGGCPLFPLSGERESYRLLKNKEYHDRKRREGKRYCKFCKKLMPIPPKNKFGQYRYNLTCSQACSRALIVASKKGDKNPMKRADVRKQVSETIKKKHSSFFSTQMKRTWRLQRDHMITAWQEANSRKPTGFELQVTSFLNRHGLPFQYTGDFSFWIGPCQSGKRRNPDYKITIKGQKKLILAHGRYWHSDEEKNQIELEDYKSKGWEAMIIWDDEPLDEALAIRIKNFAGLK